jgi:very-short-patch-repair endonuclease
MVTDHARRHGWQRVHRGVYALTQAPLTRRQLWFAATLTAPACVLSHASAGACWGFWPFEGRFETVTRPGGGGPRRYRRVLVCRSRTLAGNTTRRDGIPITTAARTVIDLSPHLGDGAVRKMFRESLRLKTTSALELQGTISRHPGRSGTKLIGGLAARYSSLPYSRCRSDAEACALELIHDAGVEPPRVNRRIAGEEADLAWPSRRLIIEIDGPQYHQFPDEDARKTRRWRAAGFTVRRIDSDRVFERPHAVLALLQ